MNDYPETLKKELKDLEKAMGFYSNEKQKLEERASYLRMLLWNDVRNRFYEKYGVQDFVVRKEYMDLVKSGAYEYPYDEEAEGYVLILWNLSPFGGSGYPLSFKGDDGKRETLTEFISKEHMEKCKITPKIEEAFLILRHFSDPDFKTKSFLISAKAGKFNDLEDASIDDYKVHLVKE